MHSLGCKQNPVCVPKSVAQFPQSAKKCRNSIINYFSTKKCYFGSNVILSSDKRVIMKIITSAQVMYYFTSLSDDNNIVILFI